MRHHRTIVATVLALVLAGAACGSTSKARSSSPPGTTVTLVSHDSFAASKSVIAAFTRQTGFHLRVLKSGDAGAALNQVILTKGHPLGDAMFGVDNTFLSRALGAGVFVKYVPKDLERTLPATRLDPSHHLTPVDYGDVCVNYDKRWFSDHRLTPPRTFDDLAAPAYRGRLVVENPATSSPGLAFLLATVAHYRSNGWRDYWSRLRANDVRVVDGWEQAYNSDFSGSSGKGPYPLVVSYASSPPAEVYYANPHPAEAPTAVMTDTCFRQVEFVGVLAGARHPDAARALVDFMLSPRFQADVPLQMFVWPARTGTPLPSVFTRFALLPAKPLTLPPRRIGAERDRLVDEWTATVLR